MRLPRWTVYPALALIFGIPMAIVGNRPEPDPNVGAALRARATTALAPAQHPRLVVLGVDGLDPDLLEEAMRRFPGETPNFRWLAEKSGVHSLGTSTPPQSPVAWSNFITGLDPGGHGIFDFLHRNPDTRMVIGSTMEDVPADNWDLWGDWKIPSPFAEVAGSNRTGVAFWELLDEAGVPADLWRMPINFPVEPSRGVSIPGMMTPALDSAYGTSTLYTDNPLRTADPAYAKYDQNVKVVKEFGGKIDTSLTGPPNAFKKKDPHAHCPLKFFVDRDANAVAIDTGTEIAVLRPGEWSEWLGVTFDMDLPDFGAMDASGIVRFHLRSIAPDFELYASPVDIDPEAPVMPVSEPEDASADLAKAIGRYYTQGMAEDVGGLKNELISVEEFIEQVQLVYDERRSMMEYALDRYIANEDGGLLFFYYSTVDLTSHMMWRHGDEQHPHHDPAIAARSSEHWTKRAGSTWKDTTFDVILKMDPVIGRLRERLGDDVTYIVMSDHGFAPYRREFSLNTWLLEKGYLVLKAPEEVDGEKREYARELDVADPNHQEVFLASAVDWDRTRAYGIGFNGLYLNLEGREGDNPLTPDVEERGIVKPGKEAEMLLTELKRELEALVDAKTGEKVVFRADIATEVYTGARVAEAPDILVGYNTNYGNSDAASSGRIPLNVLQDNLGGTFNGSHLMAPDVVAGTLLSNRPVRQGRHQLEDVTVQILHEYGVEPAEGMSGHPVLVD